MVKNDVGLYMPSNIEGIDYILHKRGLTFNYSVVQML